MIKSWSLWGRARVLARFVRRSASLSRAGALGLLVLASPAWVLAEVATPERPNIIFILADDLGPDGVSCYGAGTYAGLTPRLDSLAAQGIRFTRCHGGAICSPGRAEYLSGQYPCRNGTMFNAGGNYIDSNEPVVTDALRRAGYLTGGVGKSVNDRFTYLDDDGHKVHFMEEFLESGTGAYWDYEDYQLQGPTNIDPSPANYPYFPDAMQAYALDFIERNYPRDENGHRPFYLYYSMIHPHHPIVPTPKTEAGKKTEREIYPDYLVYIDERVGGLVDKLAELDQLDRTLIVFTSDNGAVGALQGTLVDPKSGQPRRISGSKSDEAELREGATLVPLIVHWPDAIKQPMVSDDLVDFTDMLPTFAEVAGADLPSEWVLDGKSFAPLLRGDPAWKPRAWLFKQFEYNWWASDADYRLNRDGRLFDLSDLPFSMREIRPENDIPESAAARARLQVVLDELDPISGPTYEGFMDFRFNPPVWKWKKTHWNWALQWQDEISGDAADPDADGVPNILERAFGWDPLNGTDAMPSLVPGPDGVIALPETVADSHVAVSVVTEDGQPRLHAERTADWPMPPVLPENRPAVVQ